MIVSFTLFFPPLGHYLSVLCQIESLAQSFKAQLQERGIHVPVSSQWPRDACLESLKFLFKQLRKAVEDSSSSTFGKTKNNRITLFWLFCYKYFIFKLKDCAVVKLLLVFT